MLLRIYRQLNILSLDIVAGAVMCSLFFARVMQVEVLPYAIIALALTVWIIYTADHLRDAYNIGRAPASPRHRFHYVYFRWVLAAMLVTLVLDVVVIFFMREKIFLWGIALSLIVGLYLVIQAYLRWAKEIFVALLYSCGVLLPVMSLTGIDFRPAFMVLFFDFALLAFLNLLLFSWFDYERDLLDGQRSFATVLGKPVTELCIKGCAMANTAITCALLAFGLPTLPALILFTMNVLLFAIFALRSKARQHDAYRLLGDAVFLIPGVYLI